MTEHRISFKVAGEPVPTPRPRTVTKGGKTWTYSGNKAYKDWLKAIKRACVSKHPEHHNFDGAMLKVYFITDKKIDLDNAVKGVMDALTGVLWDNDKVIWDLHITRLEAFKGEPHTDIEVIGEEPSHTQACLPVPEGWTAKPLGKALTEAV